MPVGIVQRVCGGEGIEIDSMVPLSLMEEAWKNSRKAIFRLEIIPEYNVPEDVILFENGKQGKFEFDADARKWLHNLKSTKERNVNIQRVRVVPLPFPEYIKYEIEFWKHSIPNGEEIFFLESKEYENIIKNLDFEPKDFWLFDDEILIIFHYDETGNFVKEKLISNEEMIKKHAELKKELLKRAIPMEEFLKKNLTSSRHANH